MILELKLRKVGNSLGLVLPKEALAYLKVEEGDTVTVTGGQNWPERVFQQNQLSAFPTAPHRRKLSMV